MSHPEPHRCAARRYTLFATLSFLLSLCLWGFTWAIRRRIRTRDRIPATCCGCGLDDPVCALFCMPCVQCQVMRHEGMTYGRYDLCSPTGQMQMLPV